MKHLLLRIFSLSLIFAFTLLLITGNVFSQGHTYTSEKGYSFHASDTWKELTSDIYFGGRETGGITMQDLGIDKGIILTTADSLERPYMVTFGLGDTGPQDFETAIADANNVLGLGVIEFSSSDDIRSLMIANPGKVLIDKNRKILIGEGDPEPNHPELKSIAATLMGDSKGALFILYTNDTRFQTDIDEFLEIIATVHCD